MEDVSMPSGADKPEKRPFVTGPATMPLDGLLSMNGIDTCSTCAAHKERPPKYDTCSQEFVGTGQGVNDSYRPMFDTQSGQLVGMGAYPEDIVRGLPPLKFATHSEQFVGPDVDVDDDK
jgi:hypothetical protein